MGDNPSRFGSMARHYALRSLSREHAIKKDALREIRSAIDAMCDDNVQEALQQRYLALGGMQHGDARPWRVSDMSKDWAPPETVTFSRMNGSPGGMDHVTVDLDELVDPKYMQDNTSGMLEMHTETTRKDGDMMHDKKLVDALRDAGILYASLLGGGGCQPQLHARQHAASRKETADMYKEIDLDKLASNFQELTGYYTICRHSYHKFGVINVVVCCVPEDDEQRVKGIVRQERRTLEDGLCYIFYPILPPRGALHQHHPELRDECRKFEMARNGIGNAVKDDVHAVLGNDVKNRRDQYICAVATGFMADPKVPVSESVARSILIFADMLLAEADKAKLSPPSLEQCEKGNHPMSEGR